MIGKRLASAGIVLALVAGAAPLRAQGAGAVRLHELVRGLTVTARALVIGVRPEDDDGQLLAWLARGRSVETGFLSLTRGESAPNYIGTESGTPFGAIRTQEALASRRIDGAAQFFTRAFDVGSSRTAAEAFKHWPRDTLLADVVTVIRSFRPHVLIATMSRGSGRDAGEYAALDTILRDAFDAAGDTTRFPTARYGMPWTPAKLYRHGMGIRIDPNEFDAVVGKTYTDLASESRAQRRSEGFTNGLLGRAGTIRLERLMSHVSDSTSELDEKSIFDGIDTTFTRLAARAPHPAAAAIPLIAAYADSARSALDLAHPDRVGHFLAQVFKSASSARAAVPWCFHPSTDAAPPAVLGTRCETWLLDLDASIDLVRKRAADAALIAAGVSFEATIDRELVADGDTATATVTMYNFGTKPVTLAGVVVPSGPIVSPRTVVVPPDSLARAFRRVTNLVNQQPWWIGAGREKGSAMFPVVPSSVDGLSRRELLTRLIGVPGVAVPEGLRRETDVSVSVVIDDVTVTTSIGPLVYRYADATVGVQDRTAGGAPAVTLEFDHSLEWIPANKPINRSLRLAVKSFSDAQQTFTLRIISPAGVRLDSAPSTISLAPHEQRDVSLHLRGVLKTGRYEFAVIGMPVRLPENPGFAPRSPYIAGFQTVQYPYLPPVRVFHSSGIYLQAVEISIPAALSVIFVKGVLDDIPTALKHLGVSSFAIGAEDVLALNLSQVTTVVIGRSAYELHPELVAQNSRLMDFVRGGGTLLVQQGGFGTAQSGVLPYPISFPRTGPERIAQTDAPVKIIDSKARVLTWPNAIRDTDWTNWVGGRAQYVPTTVDARYSSVIEMHDTDQPENRNTILVAHIGKGTYVYTTLTFFDQIPAGVPGSMRLFVNLLSGSVSGKLLP